MRPLQDAIRCEGGETAWFFDGPGAEYLRDGDEARLTYGGAGPGLRPPRRLRSGKLGPRLLSRRIKVEVFHGFSVGKRSDNEGHFRIRGLFDLYCTQGPATTRKFSALAARHRHFHVEETGWPKLDPMFDGRERAASPWTSGWRDERPIVLFASTFTSGMTSAPSLREPIRRLAASGRWNWLVTLHPKMPEEIRRGFRDLEGPNLRFAGTEDVVPLLQAADVMVSDTSSIAHEFLVLHKPVVTFRNRRPGPYLIDIQQPAELAGAIETALSRPQALIARISEFARSIHPYRDGKSSERVLAATRELLDKHRAGLARKPLNIWRKIRLRRRLGYYRLR